MRQFSYKKLISLTVAGGLLAASNIATTIAGDLTLPTPTFTGGEPLTASQLNGNFTAIETEVDGNAKDLVDHAANPSAHHSRYTDAEAQSAMGATANTNTLNHSRYTDTEAQSAVTGMLSAVKEGRNDLGLGPVITADSTTPEDLTTLTVTPPADGYILVMASGRVGVNQTVAADNLTYLSISIVSQQHDSQYMSSLIVDTGGGAANRVWAPLNITRVEAATQGTPVTFYLTAYRDGSGSNTLYAGPARLTALFIPNLLP
jgi:hypothetical protein